ncbi:hypothetical protein DdX_07510 [Ditylenchus destructor]|uniref:Uncharacterized protein n=1 Tax=Ditylenchus destructor TaxID=166010 RepID=A0AAD4N9P7_9BILA|nr:hypothetical protein DdX_07510 [Ditylenchus destructor]
MLERRGQRPNPHKKSLATQSRKRTDSTVHVLNPLYGRALSLFPPPWQNPRANEMWQKKVISKAKGLDWLPERGQPF